MIVFHQDLFQEIMALSSHFVLMVRIDYENDYYLHEPVVVDRMSLGFFQSVMAVAVGLT